MLKFLEGNNNLTVAIDQNISGRKPSLKIMNHIIPYSVKLCSRLLSSRSCLSLAKVSLRLLMSQRMLTTRAVTNRADGMNGLIEEYRPAIKTEMKRIVYYLDFIIQLDNI
jgi:hypothetical protein